MNNEDMKQDLWSTRKKSSGKKTFTVNIHYCSIVIGIILVIVGIFITSLAYLSELPDQGYYLNLAVVSRVIGPLLLGFGGILTWIGIVFANESRRDTELNDALTSADFFTIGESSFYDQSLVLPGSGVLRESPSHYDRRAHFNPGLVDDNPRPDQGPIKFLANAIVQERRRKFSELIPPEIQIGQSPSETYKKIMDNNEEFHQFALYNHPSSPKTQIKSVDDQHFDCMNQPQYRGWKSPNCEECCVECQTEESFTPQSRKRFHSVVAERPQFRYSERIDNLRRVSTLTPNAQRSWKEDLQRRKHIRHGERESRVWADQRTPNMNRTKRKTAEKNITASNPNLPAIHQLPSYNPVIVQKLIDVADQSTLAPLNQKDIYKSLPLPKKSPLNRDGLNASERRQRKSRKSSKKRYVDQDGLIPYDMPRSPSVSGYSRASDEERLSEKEESDEKPRSSPTPIVGPACGEDNPKMENPLSPKPVGDDEDTQEKEERSSRSSHDSSLSDNKESFEDFKGHVPEVPEQEPPSPPSPSLAGSDAVAIMQTLRQASFRKERVKVLSVISSQDEE